MSTVRVVEESSIEWRSVGPEQRERFRERGIELTPEELAGRFRYHHQGSDTEPEMLEVRFEPGTVVNAHAHRRDEIIYVLEGELVLGRRVLGPGSSLFIAANSLYGFRAGDAGLRFVNFRPTSGSGYVSKEELMAERKSDSGSADAPADEKASA